MSSGLIDKATELARAAVTRGPQYLPVVTSLIGAATKLVKEADAGVSLETLQKAERIINAGMAKVEVRNEKPSEEKKS